MEASKAITSRLSAWLPGILALGWVALCLHGLGPAIELGDRMRLVPLGRVLVCASLIVSAAGALGAWWAVLGRRSFVDAMRPHAAPDWKPRCGRRFARARVGQARRATSPRLARARDFEVACAGRLRGAGWDAMVTGQRGDLGVDIVATRDGRVLVVQCKAQRQRVGVRAIQEVFTGRAIYRAQEAVVVSASGFTRSAWRVAGRTGVRLLTPQELGVV